MKNKKTAAFLFCMILAFGMAAAGCTKKAEEGKQAEETEKTAEAEQTEKPENTEELENTEESESAAENTGEDSQEGKSSPYGNLNSFLAATLEGETFSQEDLADKDLTVINFWALTCGPCIREMPDLASLEKALPDNVQLLTVCLDGGQDLETTKAVLKETGYEGITIVAGDGDLLEICRKLQYTPTTLFFDTDGTGVGDAIIGAQPELETTYLTAINSTLEELGKEAVTLE